ncbi:ABC transporter permease [Muricomes intestini]|uniref:ABC-2 type transport system permease protein n=1 Tax=Muricomes intestini TaxID=1796634 RepID=A0A4R3K1Q3_9FIRM|nr:ABC transporter permease [Muricomes intestini]TCS75766.1 ABC-2 type transport system permease protein [Muricomes intestini]HAX50903.1 ABC transporter permease [Lachnospiraceae bacterium]HCR81920.1 ABC transporter permease [Lachnospiraceae bacterium]
MLHLMKYDVKVKLHNFNRMFWPLLFPLILATLFYFAFGKMDEADFETVPVAVVEETNSSGEKTFLDFLYTVEKDKSKLIKTEVMGEKQAVKALKSGKVSGIYYAGEKLSLTVSGVGIKESILQSLLESYENGKNTIENIAVNHPEGIQSASEQMSDYRDMVKQVSLGGKTTDQTAQFFYALIAMACLYGCFSGYGTALYLQANLTALAARKCVTPTHKLKLILSEMLTSFFMHFVDIVILLIYLRYVLGMDFRGDIPRMLLVSFIGSMIGVSMGIFISSIGKTREGAKIGILLGISMVCSFLAGLMVSDMKDIVERYCPIINRINPAALIADAFYCINVYDDPARFWRSLAILTVMSVLLTLGSFFMVRRERYDSI